MGNGLQPIAHIAAQAPGAEKYYLVPNPHPNRILVFWRIGILALDLFSVDVCGWGGADAVGKDPQQCGCHHSQFDEGFSRQVGLLLEVDKTQHDESQVTRRTTGGRLPKPAALRERSRTRRAAPRPVLGRDPVRREGRRHSPQ